MDSTSISANAFRRPERDEEANWERTAVDSSSPMSFDVDAEARDDVLKR